jgi:CheY-like chemotaxis protein
MKPIKCFLIDDDTDEHDLFEMALQDMGQPYEYLTSFSCPDAYKMLEEDQNIYFDYIFLDLNMPFLTGLECLRKLKQLEHLQNIMIVMYTTSSNQNDVQKAKDLGASHFLTKQSRITDLIRILSLLFERKQLPFLLK